MCLRIFGGSGSEKIKNCPPTKNVQEHPGTTGGHRGTLPEPKNAKNQHLQHVKKSRFQNAFRIISNHFKISSRSVENRVNLVYFYVYSLVCTYIYILYIYIHIIYIYIYIYTYIHIYILSKKCNLNKAYFIQGGLSKLYPGGGGGAARGGPAGVPGALGPAGPPRAAPPRPAWIKLG